MSFEIYFDESQKIDKKSSVFSFYGIIGTDYKNRKQIESAKKEIFNSELHFSQFKITQIDYYIDILRESMDLLDIKIYVVDTEFAFESSKRLSISEDILRKLFYVKIPERLIYGMTRYFKDFTEIDIYIDKSSEYGNDNLEFLNSENKNKLKSIIKNEKLTEEQKYNEIENLTNKIYHHVQLTKTLKEQLNAQSLYRNLNFKVNNVKQQNSKESVCLQISDVILGILGFLFEEKYLDMPSEIKSNKMNELMQLDSLTDIEKELLENSYKYNQNIDRYSIKVKPEELDTMKELRDLNKKLKIYAAKNIGKSEFIYRALLDKKILNKLNDINIFMWPSQDSNSISSKVDKMFFSHYMSSFFKFKHEFDNDNKNKILKFHNGSINESKYKIDDYTKCLQLPTNLFKMTDRYLDELGIKKKS